MTLNAVTPTHPMMIRLLTLCITLLVIALPLAAQDELVLGTGSTSTCIMATTSTVTVPVYIRDVDGTSLDVDKPGTRIQAYSFRIFVSPDSAFQKTGPNINAVVENAGITAGRPAVFQVTVPGSNSITYIVSFDESMAPLPFDFDAPGWGDLVANVIFNLNPDAPASTIQLELDPENTLVSDFSGVVTETVESGELRLRNTCIQPLADLQATLGCPGLIRVGEMEPATINLDQPAPSAVNVALTSNSQVASVPSTVSIAAGSSSASFNITALASGSATITATLPASVGGDIASCTVNVFSCPEAPAPISPLADASDVPLQGALQWNATGASTYRVFLGSAGTGCTTLLGTTPGTSIGYSGLLPATEYEWRVESQSSGCPNVASSCVRFTTESTPPVIRSFLAAPSRIAAGASATLVWSVSGAETVTIAPEPGTVAPSGSVQVTPTTTTTYTLNASGPSGSATATTTVVVETAPRVVVLEWPEPLLATPGEPSTISRLVLANTGGSPATVALDHDETLFSVSDSTMVIGTGEVEVVEISGENQEPGAFHGTITINVDGSSSSIDVPVTLFVQPAGDVALPQVDSRRIDVVRDAQGAGTFSIELTNPHGAAIDVLLTPDAPWIVAAESFVTIPAGGTATAEFEIVPELRPASSGSLRNDVVIRTASGSMRVAITDTPRLLTSTQMPSMSEDAQVIPIVGNRVDVSIAPAANVTLTHIDATGNTQTLDLDGGEGLWLADPTRTIFGEEEGILVIDAGDAAVSAEGVGAAARHTIPVFHAAHGASAGDSWWITGLDSEGARIVVQDVSGTTSTVQIELIDAAGNTTSILSREVPPWRSITLTDPGAAASAIVTNNAASSGRVVSWAETTADDDTRIVTDQARAVGAGHNAERFLPHVAEIGPDVRRRSARNAPGSRADAAHISMVRTELTLFNGNPTPAEVSLVLQEDAMTPPVERTITIPARQTIVIGSLAGRFGRNAIDGMVRVRSLTGEVAVSARIVQSTSAGERSSIVPISFIPSLQSGEARTFTGLRQVTVDGERLLSADLVLVNPASEDVTVRLVAWDTATREMQNVRDLVISALSRVTVPGIASTPLAPADDDTAMNVSVTVAVTEGSGQVAPFTIVRDRANGDLTIQGE